MRHGNNLPEIHNNPKISDEHRQAIESDDPGCGKEFNFSLCRLRHMAARLKEERGERHSYDHCCYCPRFVTKKADNAAEPPEQKPEPAPVKRTTPKKEVKTMEKKPAKCKSCGDAISSLRAKNSGTCKACYHREYNAAYQRKQSEKTNKPAPKTGAEDTSCVVCKNKIKGKLITTYGGVNCHSCYDKGRISSTASGSQVVNVPKAEEYCPEPAAATIHASPPPKSEPIMNQSPAIFVLPVSITELQRLAYENATAKGWHETPRADGEMIALMHSELSEALEELRNGRAPNETYFNGQKPEGVPIELADVVIRIFDFCGQHKINLQSAIVTKMVYNQTRPHRHGGKKL